MPQTPAVTKYLGDLLRRRDLTLYLVTSQLKAQHRNTFLGYFWWLLDPLLGVFVYYFVVVVVFQRGGADYGPFLVVGLIVWRWLSASVSGSPYAIVSRANVITQVALPKVIFPLTLTLSGLINFGFGLLVIAVFFLYWGILPGTAIVWLPLVLVGQTLFTLALTSLLAYASVFVRDTDTLVNHLMRVWFFVSPVIWHRSMVPARLGWLFTVNPMAHFLDAYRAILMANQRPDLTGLIVVSLLSLVAVAGLVVFYSRNEHRAVKAL